MVHVAGKYILYKTTGIKMSTPPATIPMQGDLVVLAAGLTNGIMMITDSEVGLVKVAALAMVVVTAMVEINK